MNGDGVINILDISFVARAFATTPGNKRWFTIGDVNDDRVINILDISVVARNFGKTYTY